MILQKPKREIGTVNLYGRVYTYTDNKWVTWNPQYGPTLHNWSVGRGTGSSPSVQWNDQGVLFPAGTNLISLDLVHYTDSAEVTGVNVTAVLLSGDFILSGVRSNSELTLTTLIDAEPLNIPGESIRRYSSKLSINHVCDTDAMLCIFFQPIGSLTATRFVYTQCAISHELPVG